MKKIMFFLSIGLLIFCGDVKAYNGQGAAITSVSFLVPEYKDIVILTGEETYRGQINHVCPSGTYPVEMDGYYIGKYYIDGQQVQRIRLRYGCE